MRILPRLRFEIVKGLAALLAKLETPQADPADIYFCYRLLLGRRPEAAGWQDWCQRVRQGLGREMLVAAVLSSRECLNRHRASNQPLCVETESFRIYVNPHDLDIGRPIAQARSYEPHVTAVIKSLLKPADVFVDLGANMGWFTLTAAAIVRPGKVLAVEPNPHNVQLLYRSLIANQFEHVTVLPYAVTDAAALLQLDYAVSNGYVTAIAGNATSDEYAYVQGVKLDDLLRDEPKITLIKMDIEGHERIALRGMQGILKKHRPILITEFSPHDLSKDSPQAAAEYLGEIRQSGYALAVIEENGAIREFAAETGVLEYWRAACQRQPGREGFHLDLLARPV